MKDYFNIINDSFLKSIVLKEDESFINIGSLRYKSDKKLIDDIINKEEYKYLNEKEKGIIKKFNKSIREYDEIKNTEYIKNNLSSLLLKSNEEILIFCFKNKIGGLLAIDILPYNGVQSIYIVQGKNNISNTNLYKNEEFVKTYKEKMYDIMKIYLDVSKEDIDKIFEHELNLFNYRIKNAERRDIHKTINEYKLSELNFKNFDVDKLLKILLPYNKNSEIYFDTKMPSNYYNYIDENFNNKYFKLYIAWCILLEISMISFGILYEKVFELVKIIKGIKRKMDIEKKVYNLNNIFIGNLISKEYFINIDPTIKQRIKEYISIIMESFKSRLNENKWMDDNTKKLAIEKLESIKVDVYDSKLIDFNQMKELSEIYYENINIINEYLFDYKGKSLLNNEKLFYGNIYSINAYYDASVNKIIFPYGILKPPYYYNGDFKNINRVAYNFGAIGSVIGHEIIHGFDDQGRLFDKDGHLKNWWGKESEKKYIELSEKIGNIYKEQKINTKLTMGENIADIGGVRISFTALQLFLKKQNKELNEEIINNFIKGWTMIWRGKLTKQEYENRLINDPHSPVKMRVNVPLNNIKELNKDKEVIEIW